MNKRMMAAGLAGMMVVLAACATDRAAVIDYGPATQPESPSKSGRSDKAGPKYTYPAARTEAVTDTYHGTKVADPYRWMEGGTWAGKTGDADLKKWIEEENKLTRGVLDAVPARAHFAKRLRELNNFEKFTTPEKDHGRYFWNHNTGLQEQMVFKMDVAANGPGTVVIDPNTFPKEQAMTLAGHEFSWDGRFMAYATSQAGSDWKVWHVKHMSTMEDTTDELRWIKWGSVAWTHDNKGFFYARFPEPKKGAEFTATNIGQQLCYHVLGQPQASDVVYYERKDNPDLQFSGSVTEDGKYWVMYLSDRRSQGNGLSVRPMSMDPADFKPGAAGWIEIVPLQESSVEYLGNDGTAFYAQTNMGAPRTRIARIDLPREAGGKAPKPADWEDIVPQGPLPINSINLAGRTLIIEYIEDCCSRVKLVGLDGKAISDVKLPGDGTVSGFGGLRDESERFFTYTDAVTPPTIYRFDANSRAVTLVRRPAFGADVTEFEAKRVFFTNPDGLRVPMFIAHKKGLKLDGTNPTLLYGYGGFNNDTRARFSGGRFSFLEQGGVYATPSLRGDGDYGEAWHMSATRINKQRTFDDFIAAAEWLIKEGYTSNTKLAISGGSNGGLLVGACLNRRPDLFAAALPAVGVMDMLRFHTFTVGAGWIREYGCSDDPLEFQALYAFSPYHNVRAGTKYPAVMVTTADHDDRVVPAHSFKYTARLQAAQAAAGGESPVLIRIETKGGHGGGTTLSQALDQAADTYAFLSMALGFGVTETK